MELQIFVDADRDQREPLMRELEQEFSALGSVSVTKKEKKAPPGTLVWEDPELIVLILKMAEYGFKALRGLISIVQDVWRRKSPGPQEKGEKTYHLVIVAKGDETHVLKIPSSNKKIEDFIKKVESSGSGSPTKKGK